MNKVEALIPFKVTLLACVILRAENVTRNLIPELQLRVEFILPLLIFVMISRDLLALQTS